MISSNIAGYTKKQLTAAVVFIGYCIGNAVGPQTFIASEARMLPLSANRNPLATTQPLKIFIVFGN
jgi:hypothetical protein